MREARVISYVLSKEIFKVLGVSKKRPYHFLKVLV